MKFRIKHISSLYRWGIALPWIVIIAALAIFLIVGLDVTFVFPTLVLIRLTAVCGIAEMVFIFLYIAERIYGARLIINDDHVVIKTLHRHRKLYYAEIEDTKYSHYECTRSYRERKERSGSLLYKYLQDDEETWTRSKLTFYLTSGKTVTVNDEATNYEWKRSKWITDPDLDPDEDVVLYQAYQCYRTACREYCKVLGNY